MAQNDEGKDRQTRFDHIFVKGPIHFLQACNFAGDVAGRTRYRSWCFCALESLLHRRLCLLLLRRQLRRAQLCLPCLLLRRVAVLRRLQPRLQIGQFRRVLLVAILTAILTADPSPRKLIIENPLEGSFAAVSTLIVALKTEYPLIIACRDLPSPPRSHFSDLYLLEGFFAREHRLCGSVGRGRGGA